MTLTLLPRPDASARDARLVVLRGVAERCGAGVVRAALEITPSLLASEEACAMLRRHVVPLLRKNGAHPELVHALGCYLQVRPDAHRERLALASLLIRLDQAGEARVHLGMLAASHPGDIDVVAARLRLELRKGRADEAAVIAEGFADWDDIAPDVAHLAMVALLRAGRPARVLDLFDACETPTAELMADAVEAHFNLGDIAKAERLARRAIAQGLESAPLRYRLGTIAQAGFDHDRAIVHFTEALKITPDNARSLAALGELMLIKSRPRAALAHLGKALQQAPQLDHVRALHARALKEVRDFEGAAREWMEIVARQPGNSQWKRQAASALNLAGRTNEARRLFGELLDQRERTLPDGFEQGLDDLWSRLDEAAIPAPRLEWAWRLRSPDCALERGEWERRARWGWLADRLIFDWLECRPQRAEDAMHRLADLDAPARAIEAVVGQGEPLVIATAHIGPMFAAPLAAELIDFELVWLASSPAIAGLPYAPSLISTSDQTEPQVVRQALRALESGKAVGLAVDGAMSLAAPRIVFEGQEVTYSSFAARLAHRRRARSIFVAPQWRDGRLGFHVAPLPSPRAEQNIEDFSARWKAAYLSELRGLLAGAPENLRLSGGLWRHIRMPS